MIKTSFTLFSIKKTPSYDENHENSMRGTDDQIYCTISARAHTSFAALPTLENPLKINEKTLFQGLFQGGQGRKACMSPCRNGRLAFPHIIYHILLPDMKSIGAHIRSLKGMDFEITQKQAKAGKSRQKQVKAGKSRQKQTKAAKCG